jgi:hypothetical protein
LSRKLFVGAAGAAVAAVDGARRNTGVGARVATFAQVRHSHIFGPQSHHGVCHQRLQRVRPPLVERLAPLRLDAHRADYLPLARQAVWFLFVGQHDGVFYPVHRPHDLRQGLLLGDLHSFASRFAGVQRAASVERAFEHRIEIGWQGVGVGHSRQISGLLFGRNPDLAAFAAMPRESRLGDRHFHAIELTIGQIVAAKQDFLGSICVGWIHHAQAGHDDRQQQPGENAGAGRHRLEQLAQVRGGAIEGIHPWTYVDI